MFSFLSPKRINKQPKSVQNHEFPITIFPTIEDNLANIKEMYGSPSDLMIRRLTVGDSGYSCALVCIDGLVDKNLINDLIKNIQKFGSNKAKPTLDVLMDEVLFAQEINLAKTLDDVSLAILSGDSALFVDGTKQVLIIGTKGWESRSVEEPNTEAVVRGPREGFIEDIRTNTALLRRHVRDPNLRLETFKVGRRSKRDVTIVYITGIVHSELVDEVKRRLKTIDMDDTPESGFVEQWIEDNFLSPFPQAQNTERPDKASAAIMQGRIVILLDGTPFALIVPVALIHMIQSPEDYYERWIIGSLIRALRYLAAFVGLFLPSLYISLVSFQPGMIPSKLAFSIAGSREGVPFPAVIEALIMEATLELLREAGIRLPKAIGQTIGIVGGLVIGQAAVSAGIVSPIMVIVVSITAIANFALPSYSFAISIRILRFGMMVAAAVFGLFGVILAYIVINIHLANLKSFGIPYTTPFAPEFLKDWKDLIIRAPLTMMKQRSKLTKPEDPIRQGGQERS